MSTKRPQDLRGGQRRRTKMSTKQVQGLRGDKPQDTKTDQNRSRG